MIERQRWTIRENSEKTYTKTLSPVGKQQVVFLFSFSVKETFIVFLNSSFTEI